MGTHGLEVEFKGPADSAEKDTVFSSVYLPHVIALNNWDINYALEKLVKKAGFKGGFKAVKDRFTVIRRYQSIYFEMDFQEYQALKGDD